MFDESTHTILTNNQNNKKSSIRRTASAFFGKFYSTKSDDTPLQRDLLKRIYTTSDLLVKKENEIKRRNSKSKGLIRTSSNISLKTSRQINDLDFDKNQNSKGLPRNEPDFHVKNVERNCREQSPNKCSLFRRPATRLIDLSDISRHSDTHIETLSRHRKCSRNPSPVFPRQQEWHSVIFPDTRLNSGHGKDNKNSVSAPPSTFHMRIESDNGSLDINSESSEMSIGLPPLEISPIPSQCSGGEENLYEKKSYSEPMTPSGVKEEGWLDVSFNNVKTRPKSKSIDLTRNEKPEVIQKRSSYTNERHGYATTISSGSNSSSVEYEHRNSQKITDNSPINRSSSTKSTLSISSNVSSKSMFGRIDSHRKESKAIGLWHSTVEKLMEKSENINKVPTVTKAHSTDKIKAMAKFIIGELYSTERSFNQLLKFTHKNYMEVMQTAVQCKDPLVKASDVQVLFYALPEMIEVSEKLLKHLQKYMDGITYQDCSPGMALGHIFKELENDMVAFLKYATHYKANMKSIRKARNSGYISKIENQLKLQKANNRLGLADYLIAPFQRVPRYGLLIKDLLKYTDSTIKINVSRHETRIHPLLEAQNIIDGLAITMNQVQQKHARKSSGLYSFSTQSTTNITAQT